MRIGEITGLRWCDIDLENETIDINHILVFFSKGKSKGCTLAINTPKTEAGRRVIPMLPKLKEAFLMEKQFQEEIGLKCTTSVDGYTDFIFINRFGECLNAHCINRAIDRISRDYNQDETERAKKTKRTGTATPLLRA